MKIALLSKVVCPLTEKVIAYFAEQNFSVHCVIIEKNYRLKFSESERNWKKARSKYYRKKRKYPSFRHVIRTYWDLLPRKIKKVIYVNVYDLPVLKSNSLRKYCESIHIPCFEVSRHSSAETRKFLEELDIDYVLMISSNWLMKEPLISMVKPRIINAHPGWLPKHRGMDPIGWSLIEKDPLGFTTHFIDEGIDSGEILRFYKVEIEPGDNMQTIAGKIAVLKPFVFYDTLKGLEKSEIQPQKQEGLYPVYRPLTFEELCDLEVQLASWHKSQS